MQTTVETGGLSVVAQLAGEPTAVDDGLLLPPGDVTLAHPFGATRFYRHGWTSWSPTAWWPMTRPPLHRLDIEGQLGTPDGTRPVHRGFGVGALDGPDGNVLLLGALGLGGPSVESDDRVMTGRFENPSAPWFLAYGPEQIVFERYAGLLTERLGRRSKRAGNVWCSWYSYFQDITESVIRNVVDGLDNLPFDVVQIDDGWQQSVGDWQAGPSFANGMAGLASYISDRGLRPGLWIAPIIASADSQIFRDRRHLFLSDSEGAPIAAGHNWGAPFYALDTTLPETIDHIVGTFHRVKSWGFEYLKLDFMYAGAITAARARDVPDEQAYRDAIGLIREVVGDETYLLGCGVPIIPSIGIFDGVRVGPDTAPYWYHTARAEEYGSPSARNALMSSLHRLWLRPAFELDPDVVFCRSRDNLLDDECKRFLIDLAQVCDFRGTSDPVEWLDPSESAALKEFLGHRPRVRRQDRYRFTIDDRSVDFWPAIDPDRSVSDQVLAK